MFLDLYNFLSFYERINEQGFLLLSADIPLLALFSFIGLTVAAGPAVQFAPLHYRSLEILHHRGLSQSCERFHSRIALDSYVRTLVTWWVITIDSQVQSIHPG